MAWSALTSENLTAASAGSSVNGSVYPSASALPERSIAVVQVQRTDTGRQDPWVIRIQGTLQDSTEVFDADGVTFETEEIPASLTTKSVRVPGFYRFRVQLRPTGPNDTIAATVRIRHIGA